MKLNEIYKRQRYGQNSNGSIELKGIDFFDTAGVEPFDVEVEYEYEGPDYTDHPYGSTTAREHHGATVAITKITSTSEVTQLDDDGEKIIKTWPKGTDAMKLPGWNKKHLEWFEEQVMKSKE